MSRKIIASMFALTLAFSLTACAAEEDLQPEKKLPQDVISDVPLPYTGEVGRPQETGTPGEPGLQIFQINEDGTSQEVLLGDDTSAGEAGAAPAGTPPAPSVTE